jgi:POT family proton-dependent oligopeptide transporter
MGINVGATFGQLVTGFLGEKYGYHWGFGAAGVGMLFGLLWFTFRARSTLGNIGIEPTKNPDAAKTGKAGNDGKSGRDGRVGPDRLGHFACGDGSYHPRRSGRRQLYGHGS